MLKIFHLENSNEWDEIVKSFKDCDVYYLNGYAAPFAMHGDGEPLLFYYQDNNLRAINIVMKRDIASDENFVGKLPQNRYFDLVTPYGYGGWLIEGGGSKQELFREYEKWCVENNIVSEFVRYNPVICNHSQSEEYYEQIRLGETVAIDLSSAETVWANFTSKNRNVIRKAEKSGVTIKSRTDGDIYKVFQTIYEETMNRDHADKYYYFEPEFYTALYSKLKDSVCVYYAENVEGEIIAASIIMQWNGKLHYHLSGSKTQYRNLAPTNLLLYKVAVWGAEHNCKIFHLGGGVGAKQDNLFHFKRAFYKGDLLGYYIGKKIFNSDAYQYLISLRNDLDENTNFFPKYRG